MNNFALLLLTLLGIFADLTELAYDAGQFTRRHVYASAILSENANDVFLSSRGIMARREMITILYHSIRGFLKTS